MKDKNILSVSMGDMSIESLRSTESWDWDGKDAGQKVPVHPMFISDDYLETLNIKVIKGRGFSKKFPTDLTDGYLVNEEAVRIMGMDDPLGKRLCCHGIEGKIIGVVKDFHYGSLHSKIGAATFKFEPSIFSMSAPKLIRRIFPKAYICKIPGANIFHNILLNIIFLRKPLTTFTKLSSTCQQF